MSSEHALFSGLMRGLQKHAAAGQSGNQVKVPPNGIQAPMTPVQMENAELQDKLTNIQLKLHLENADKVIQAQQAQQAQEQEQAQQEQQAQEQAQAQADGGGATPGVPKPQNRFARNPIAAAGAGAPQGMPIDPQGMVGVG